jgi:hypothetical protein
MSSLAFFCCQIFSAVVEVTGLFKYVVNVEGALVDLSALYYVVNKGTCYSSCSTHRFSPDSTIEGVDFEGMVGSEKPTVAPLCFQ